MFYLSINGAIRLSRGDSLKLPLTIKDGDPLTYCSYELYPDDVVYFAIMEPNQAWENAIVKKVYTYDDLSEDGDVIITLKPTDTMMLLPGLYYYQIKLQLYDPESKTTIVNTLNLKTQFWIEE